MDNMQRPDNNKVANQYNIREEISKEIAGVNAFVKLQQTINQLQNDIKQLKNEVKS